MSNKFKNIKEFIKVISSIATDGSVSISFETGDYGPVAVEKQFPYVNQAKEMDLADAISNMPTTLRYELIIADFDYLVDDLKWDELDGPNDYWPGRMTSRLLIKFPEMADKADWSKLQNVWISNLLNVHPKFADRVDFGKLTKVDAWVTLLRKRPEFSDKFDITLLNKEENLQYWTSLLIDQPQFIEQCDWKNINERAKKKIIDGQPKLSKYKEK